MRLFLGALALLLVAPLVHAQTFQVAVATKTSQHPNNGQGHPDGYVIDGVQGAELTLVRGRTYTFQMNGVSTVHPFEISTSETGAGAGTWTEGVTGSGATGDGTLTFTVPESAPDQLWYQCSNHQRMGWEINIVSATDTEAAGGGYDLRLESENPARGAVRLALTVPTSQHVRAEVFAVDGRRVAVLLDASVPGGTPQRLAFDGAALPAGVYVVRVTTGGGRLEQAVTVAR